MQHAYGLEADLMLAARAEKNLILLAGNADERASADADLVRRRDAFTALLDKVEAAAATPEGRRRLAALRAAHQSWVENDDKIRDLGAVDSNLALNVSNFSS
jgi:hypothetical protein